MLVGHYDLPVNSSIVQDLLPLLHRVMNQRPYEIGQNGSKSYSPTAGALDNYKDIVSYMRSDWTEQQRERYLVFGPTQWANYTVQLLQIYQASASNQQR